MCKIRSIVCDKRSAIKQGCRRNPSIRCFNVASCTAHRAFHFCPLETQRFVGIHNHKVFGDELHQCALFACSPVVKDHSLAKLCQCHKTDCGKRASQKRRVTRASRIAFELIRNDVRVHNNDVHPLNLLSRADSFRSWRSQVVKSSKLSSSGQMPAASRWAFSGSKGSMPCSAASCSMLFGGFISATSARWSSSGSC